MRLCLCALAGLASLLLPARGDSEIIWPQTIPPGMTREEVSMSGFSIESFQYELDRMRGPRPVDLLFDGDYQSDLSACFNGHGPDGTTLPPQDLKVAAFGMFYAGKYWGETQDQAQTQNLLWRLDHGELDGLHPRLIVLQIGRFNLDAGQKPEEVAAAIKMAIERYRKACPDAHILLMGIFATYPHKDPRTIPTDSPVEKTNALLKPLDDGEHVSYLDINDKLLHPATTDLDQNNYLTAAAIERIYLSAILPYVGKWCPKLDRLNAFHDPVSPEPIVTYPFPRTPPPGESIATFPVPFDENDWFNKFDRERAVIRQKPFGIIFEGGTATFPHNLNWPSFESPIPSVNGVNASVKGDQPQNMLWRVQHGELDGLSPKLIVVTPSIDLPDKPPAGLDRHLTSSLTALAHAYEKACPQAHIVLVGVCPRGKDGDDPILKLCVSVNKLLGAVAFDDHVAFADPTRNFLDLDGSPKPDHFDEHGFLTDTGLQDWAEAVKPLIDQYRSP